MTVAMEVALVLLGCNANKRRGQMRAKARGTPIHMLACGWPLALCHEHALFIASLERPHRLWRRAGLTFSHSHPGQEHCIRWSNC